MRICKKGVNDFKTWCSQNGEFGQQLMDEWAEDIPMNSIARGCCKKVKWRCSKGHEWYASIHQRTSSKSGCPYCYREKIKVNRKQTLLTSTNFF